MVRRALGTYLKVNANITIKTETYCMSVEYKLYSHLYQNKSSYLFRLFNQSPSGCV